MHSQYYQGIWYTCKCSCGSGGGRHSIFFQWHNQFYNQYMIMTQCYDENEFRNYKIPKMCLGQDPDPCSVYMHMQHKVWISMNYILIPGFFPYQQRRGESFGQSRDVFCFGSRRNYQQIAFMVLWQKNKEYSLAYLKIPFSHENKEQICFICIEKYNEISNFWI